MELDENPVSAESVGKTMRINGAKLADNYKNNLSDFHAWEQKEHSEEFVLFAENLGKHICIDETSLTHGEVSTIVTNGDARTQKGSLVAVIDGVKGTDIVSVLEKIPLEKRLEVEEVSVDMARNMENSGKTCFPNAKIVTDRFHVAMLIHEAVQYIRVGYRWESIEEESLEIQECKASGKTYESKTYENGDTKKQLLAKSRYLLFKSKSKWSKSQKRRGKILFKEFPTIKKAYNLSMKLRNVYEKAIDKEDAEKQYEKWKKKVYQEIKSESDMVDSQETEDTTEEKSKAKKCKIKTRKQGLNIFTTVMNSIESHKDTILNYFNNRTTNALAECFNSKLKNFRRAFRGVKDISFFIYRVSKIFS